MKHKQMIWVVGCLLAALALTSCQGKDSGADSAPLASRSLPSGTAGSLVEQLAADLSAAGYSATLVATVMDYASAQLTADGTGTGTNYGAMVASIQTGAAAAIGLASSGLTTDDLKTAAVAAVSSSLAATLSSSSSSANQSGLPQGPAFAYQSSPAYAFTVTVDASSDYSSYLEALMTATIGTMDEAGVSSSRIQSDSGTLVTQVMDKLSTTSVSASFLTAALGGLTAGAIAGVDDGGVGSSDSATVSAAILSSIMGKASVFGLSSTNLENAMEDMAGKAVSALGKAGVPTASASAAAQTLMQTMMTKLTTAGVASTSFSTVMQKVSEQGVANLANAGVPSADRTAAVEDLTSAISAKVKDAGVSDSDLSTIMAAIAQGAVAGTGSLGFSDSDKQTAIANASSGALAGLKTAGYSTTQISNVSGSVTTGATKGLTQAGVATADQTTFTNKIQAGAEAGLGKAGLTAAEVTALETTLAAGINTGIAALTPTTTTTTTSPSVAITTLSFLKSSNPALVSDVTAVFNGTSITATVPFGTNVTALKPSFTHSGSYVSVGGAIQTSGVTAQNFTGALVYVVTAADNTTKTYTMAVAVGPGASTKEITAFSFTNATNAILTSTATGVITGTSIAVTLPYGTSVTSLKPTFLHGGESVTVNGTAQTSGTTAQDFTNPVTYRVTAQDGTSKDHVVTVTLAANTAKSINTFYFTSAKNSGFGISSDVFATATTSTYFSATVPFGTSLTGLIATFSTTGATVTVGGVTQISGTSANNFTSPVTYQVTAADGSTQNYTVNISVTAPATTKAITAFGFTTALNSGAGVTTDVAGIVNGTSISVTLPYGTIRTSLTPTFTTTGTSVTVSGSAQTSGATAQDFTIPVTYRVTAQDSSFQDYQVTVSLALNPAKDFTAFGFTFAFNSMAGIGASVAGVIGSSAIEIAVPRGTTVTALTPTFTHTGASVKLGGVTQLSETNTINYTSSLVYQVTAADGSIKEYQVTVVTRNPVPDTGQTTCWDGSGSVIGCPAAGNALAQDGSYNSVNQPSYSDNVDGTVTDNVTGLVWQRTPGVTTYNWAGASSYCSFNTANLPGGSGWRLPTVTELSWLVKNEGTAPTIHAVFAGTSQARYWSSTIYQGNPSFAWFVNFSNGVVENYSTTFYDYVRCVR